MKKIISVLLIMVLVFCITSCGEPESDVKGSLKTEETNTDNKSNENNTNEEVDLSLGLAEGNVYESEFLKIGFNLIEGWTFYTEEQIQQLNNITGDMLDDEIAESIKNADLVYDMYALDTLGNSVNINLEKLNTVGSAILSEEDYVNASLGSLKDALKSMGFTTVTTEATTVTLAGEDHPAVYVVCANEQLTMYEKIVCKKIGKYMASITIATVMEDNTDTIISQFYALK